MAVSPLWCEQVNIHCLPMYMLLVMDRCTKAIEIHTYLTAVRFGTTVKLVNRTKTVDTDWVALLLGIVPLLRSYGSGNQTTVFT